MSQDTPVSAVSDLSYLRALAAAGKEAPLMGGPYLVAGGSWFAAASLIQWPILRELAGISAEQAILGWLVSAVGFAAHLALLIRRDRGRVESSANRVVNTAWTGAGLGIFAFWIGAAIMAYNRGDPTLMTLISLHVLCLYGVAWTVAGAAAGKRWMYVVAGLAFLCAPAIGAFAGTGHEYLIYAAALVATGVAPGLRLSRDARSAPGGA